MNIYMCVCVCQQYDNFFLSDASFQNQTIAWNNAIFLPIENLLLSNTYFQ